MIHTNWNIEYFLEVYSGMAVGPERSTGIILQGNFSFSAFSNSAESITDNYELLIKVPAKFPRDLPTVFEVGNKIPKTKEFHVVSNGAICLGSPLQLLKTIDGNPCLVNYSEKCIIPYLYAISEKLKNKSHRLLFDELPHGIDGLAEDYEELFGIKGKSKVRDTLALLALRQRLANKKPCPCGCGKRLGCCEFREKLHEYRHMVSRKWHKNQLLAFDTYPS